MVLPVSNSVVASGILNPIKFIVLIVLLSTGLLAQSQNPFDIHERKSIDSAHHSATIQKKVTQLSDSATSQITQDTFRDSTVITNTSLPPAPTRSRDTSLVSGSGAEISEGMKPPASDGPVQIEGLAPEITKSGQEKESVLSPSDGENISVSWWHYIFDLVLLLLLLGAFLYDKKIFSPLRKAFVHENFLRFLYRDTYLRKPGVFLYLNIIFLLSLGFILYRTIQYFGHAANLGDYLIIQGIVFLLFIIKQLALEFLSRLVDKPFEVRFYRYWMILSAGIIGLWMIPVTLMVSVLPAQFLFIALVICCIPIVLLLIYRQVKAMVQAKFFLFKHFFHFFLYFCAVEIVPVVLLADVLVNN